MMSFLLSPEPTKALGCILKVLLKVEQSACHGTLQSSSQQVIHTTLTGQTSPKSYDVHCDVVVKCAAEGQSKGSPRLCTLGALLQCTIQKSGCNLHALVFAKASGDLEISHARKHIGPSL